MSTTSTVYPVASHTGGGRDRRPAPATLVAVELRKSVDTVVGRWLLVVLAVITVGALVLTAAVSDPGERSFATFTSAANGALALLVPVLGVLLVSGEFSQRTLLQTFALVPSRSQVVIAKTVAGAVLGLGAALTATLLAAATTGVMSAIDPDTSWNTSAAALGQIAAMQMGYVLVGVAFGLLFQNTPAAVVAYLVLPVILTLVTALVPSFATPGAWLDLSSATQPLTSGETASAREWARAGTSLAVWFGPAYAIGLLRLVRREIA